MTMITPSYLGETIEYSSLHACRSTLEDPTPIGAQRHPPQFRQRAKRGGRIAAAAAQPRLQGNPFRQPHADAVWRAASPGRAPQPCGRAPHEIRTIDGTYRIIADHFKRSANGGERQCVVERDRLECRAQLVIAIPTRTQHVQREIDLRERVHAHEPSLEGTPRRGVARSGRGAAAPGGPSPA